MPLTYAVMHGSYAKMCVDFGGERSEQTPTPIRPLRVSTTSSLGVPTGGV